MGDAMIDLLSVFVCPKCGDVLSDKVQDIEIIDCVNDDVFKVSVCSKCTSEVRLKRAEDGSIPVYEKVDHERWLWANGYYDESNPDDDDDRQEDAFFLWDYDR